jgi:hypothetical protein
VVVLIKIYVLDEATIFLLTFLDSFSFSQMPLRLKLQGGVSKFGGCAASV